ncbi:unnamed protein product [Prorocentrum cordatum]|uniref:Uncharacterized protein n=1 Tax=Prorocentrum cordatum TaxID=2364126 RepID=A0ABN9SR36_9DINO|nr:unnamed protein product [Polarella glacialis]
MCCWTEDCASFGRSGGDACCPPWASRGPAPTLEAGLAGPIAPMARRRWGPHPRQATTLISSARIDASHDAEAQRRGRRAGAREPSHRRAPCARRPLPAPPRAEPLGVPARGQPSAARGGSAAAPPPNRGRPPKPLPDRQSTEVCGVTWGTHAGHPPGRAALKRGRTTEATPSVATGGAPADGLQHTPQLVAVLRLVLGVPLDDAVRRGEHVLPGGRPVSPRRARGRRRRGRRRSVRSRRARARALCPRRRRRRLRGPLEPPWLPRRAPPRLRSSPAALPRRWAELHELEAPKAADSATGTPSASRLPAARATRSGASRHPRRDYERVGERVVLHVVVAVVAATGGVRLAASRPSRRLGSRSRLLRLPGNPSATASGPATITTTFQRAPSREALAASAAPHALRLRRRARLGLTAAVVRLRAASTSVATARGPRARDSRCCRGHGRPCDGAHGAPRRSSELRRADCRLHEEGGIRGADGPSRPRHPAPAPEEATPDGGGHAIA